MELLRRRLGLVALTLLALLSLSCSLGEERHTAAVRWGLLSAHHDQLAIEASRSQCQRFERLSVNEERGSVDITVEYSMPADVACAAPAVVDRHTISLAGPLADRTLTGCQGEQPPRPIPQPCSQ